MFAKAALIAALFGMQLSIPLGKPRLLPVAKAPIESSGPMWAATCKDWDDWTKPAPPVRIHGNTYLVGTCGISAILITGSDGDILIDGGPADAADLIAANIRRLGFALSDIKIILVSHEHSDHVGGIARLQQLSGAQLYASAPAARALSAGTATAEDPQSGSDKPFPRARVDRIIADGAAVRVGDLMLTAVATPGHTPGATSWRWTSCDGGVCRSIVYADSLSPVSRDGYRFSDHPAYLAAYRASLAKIAASDCEILLTPHPSGSDLRSRLMLGKTLLDPDGCKTYAAKAGRDLDARLAKEAAPAK